jgi:hypothetical protein
VVSAAANANINPANGSVFIYNGGANTIDPTLFGGGGATDEGSIIWVYAPTSQVNAGVNLAINEVGCFVYVNGGWRIVAGE